MLLTQSLIKYNISLSVCFSFLTPISSSYKESTLDFATFPVCSCWSLNILCKSPVVAIFTIRRHNKVPTTNTKQQCLKLLIQDHCFWMCLFRRYFWCIQNKLQGVFNSQPFLLCPTLPLYAPFPCAIAAKSCFSGSVVFCPWTVSCYCVLSCGLSCGICATLCCSRCT